MIGRRVHTGHLGYDLYTCGPPSQQQVRCILRRHRIPLRVPPDVRDLLPNEFRWPTGTHEEAWLAIDAMVLVDVATLASTVRQYPGHHFGFEDFIERGRRWRSAAAEHGSAPLPDIRATDGPPGAPGRTRARSYSEPLFPGWVKHIEPMDPIPLEALVLRPAIVYFTDGTPALRIDAYPPDLPPDRGNRLTRIHADLASNKYEIVEHYPGRYLALGLDPKLLAQLLHVRKLGDARRTIHDHPDVLRARNRARLRAEEGDEGHRNRSSRIVEESRQLSRAANPDPDPERVFGPDFVGPGNSR